MFHAKFCNFHRLLRMEKALQRHSLMTLQLRNVMLRNPSCTGANFSGFSTHKFFENFKKFSSFLSLTPSFFRYNIATELTERAKNEGTLALVGILVWLRYMATRQLVWNKNYNVKPRLVIFSTPSRVI